MKKFWNVEYNIGEGLGIVGIFAVDKSEVKRLFVINEISSLHTIRQITESADSTAIFTVDKTEWDKGEWTDEADEDTWIDEETNLLCRVKRNHTGAFCGYVRLLKLHKFYNSHYDELNEENIEVHGGVTWNGPLDELPGFFVGFDCAHAYDTMPYHKGIFMPGPSTYKNLHFVKEQVKALAKQM